MRPGNRAIYIEHRDARLRTVAIILLQLTYILPILHIKHHTRAIIHKHSISLSDVLIVNHSVQSDPAQPVSTFTLVMERVSFSMKGLVVRGYSIVRVSVIRGLVFVLSGVVR